MAEGTLAAVRPLQRFAHLGDLDRDELFWRAPRSPRAARGPAEVGVALGAVLYSPATTPGAVRRLIDGAWPGVTAAVLCLEDAIATADLQLGEANLKAGLEAIASTIAAGRSRDTLPYLFVRIRSPRHLDALLEAWGPLVHELDGFVLPKITVETASRFFVSLQDAQSGRDRPLWALPILEGPDVAFREARHDHLLALAAVLRAHADLVPGVRIGATDLSGLWGLRRSRDFTIYDLAVVAEVIADVVNVFARADGVPVISGPVWEYVRDEPVFKRALRETPFREEFGEAAGPALRDRLLSSALDGLVRETLLDLANGLHGKTVIHPSHVAAVDAAHAVGYEELRDAEAIIAAGASGGVRNAALAGGQRMNEPGPHQLWAERTLRRADAFGVLRAEHSFLALLPGGAPAASREVAPGANGGGVVSA